MRAYKTLSSLDAVTGALRSFDLLGQLPVRQPPVHSHQALHDWEALADDWRAVGADLQAAFDEILDDQLLQEAMMEVPDPVMERLHEVRERLEEELRHVLELLGDDVQEEVRMHAEELLRNEGNQAGETLDRQMPLFGAEVDESAG